MAPDPARDRALAKADQIRRVRAEVVDAVSDGSLRLGEVFERSTDQPMVGVIKILTVLESVPGVGKVRARRLLEAVGIDESERIDQVDAGRRSSLLEELDQ